jgi:DNA-binding ferritin-like protein (Dps family)
MTDSQSNQNQKPYNLFEDENLKSQFDALPEDDKKAYKRAGEYIYSKDVANVNLDSRFNEAAEYIKLGLRSGLFPKYLSDDEKALMANLYGSEWYKDYDYPSADYGGENM